MMDQKKRVAFHNALEQVLDQASRIDVQYSTRMSSVELRELRDRESGRVQVIASAKLTVHLHGHASVGQ